MANIGIDYGNGMANCNHETGIRYGVIHHRDIGQAWYEESEAQYGSAHCPQCGNDVKTAAGKYRKYEHAKNECSDYVCHDCKYVFGSESAFPESPIEFTYGFSGYVCSQSGEDCDIFVIKSPYYTLCAFCSPCAPGAGYIMDSREDGVKAYCFGHDWYEGGKAPYDVYDVKTGLLIQVNEREL